MNNNNLYNTNTFIGITHLDYFKTASNALSNQIVQTSNILEQHLYTTSNILEQHLNYTSNILDIRASNFTTTTSNLILARYDKLINEKNEDILLPIPTTLKHTYIMNSNVAGEIRFWCKDTQLFPIVVPSGVPDYRVKIDVDGRLKVYYTYDPAINLTFFNGWIDVGNSIVALNASDANITATIGAIDVQVNLRITELDTIVNQILIGLQYAMTEEQYENMTDEIAAKLGENDITTMNWTSLKTNLNNFFRTGTLSYLQNAINIVSIRLASNPIILTFLGIGGIAFAAYVSARQNIAYIDTINSLIKQKIDNSYTSNIITANRRIELLASNNELIVDNYIEYCSNIYNGTVAQGFINTNITTQQIIPSLKTSALSLNSGNITQLNTINGTTAIFGTVATTNNTNEAVPSKGNFGGIGDNIIIKTGSSTTYPYSIGYETNALWMSAEDNINFYNKGVKTLTLTNDNNVIFNYGNVSGINTIDVNNLTISGKITQYGELLDNTYLTSNALYTLSYNYTTERQYPPKAFNTSTSEKSVSFLGNLVYNQTLILDNTGISYGEGQYELYSSSTYDIGITTKDKLFNYNTSETVNTPRWGINLYNSGTGNYQGNSTIDGVHYGSWFIIRLPKPIILTRFRIYKNTLFEIKNTLDICK
jgi:hypothetical protein